ncbi:thiolase family protein [Leptospira semungkisensis]|uniref:Thiolase family protein n=1 Tax=Leptospira semungkisensis TaxID=2484985 RepID=A0A4R9G7C8_9LEPT|nr:thiolase family protein [Leptospira semungkisensis]TGK06697.1 thiolase family protein [Leptospira semungkisensis]
MKLEQKLAICTPRRTPFAQIAKGLGAYPAHHLGQIVAEDIISHSGIKKEDIDGIIVGEGFPSSPNPARVIANLIGLRDEMPSITLSNNCVSGLEAVSEAARRIILGEGELFLVIGEESQTDMPFIVKNARLNKKAGSLEKLKKLLPDNLPEGVELRDTLEDGLDDGENSYGMQVTAEILAQNYNLSREITDKVAFESFKRTYDASMAGKYEPFIIPMKDEEGNDLKIDEAVILRKGLVENPSRMSRAMLLFDNPQSKFEDFLKKYGKDITRSHGPTVSIFNASPRSDGAAGVIITTVEKAKALGLKIEGVLSGWRMKGVHPNLMGLGQAVATEGLLEDLNLKIQDMDYVEIHEAYGATAVAAMEQLKTDTGWDWEKMFDEKKINPNGGSIAIGHPFGATGVRLVNNAVMDLQEDPSANKILITACAHGGIAGSMLIERYKA